jgi:hypothetical protein
VGSVCAMWVGQCRETSAREELCLRIIGLGEISHSFFRPVPPPIKRFDQTIEGDILIAEHLFPSPPATPKLTRVSERFFSLERVSLFGVEFRLYDGRGLYEGEDRMSFVFCVDDDPEIDGIMVYVDEGVECLNYKDERARRADFVLTVPNVHLRYYLEDWADYLIGWVKYHYVNDLRYWRYGDKWTSGNALKEQFGQFGRYEYYEMLKSEFEDEVAKWADKAREVSQFWKSARRLREDIDEN